VEWSSCGEGTEYLTPLGATPYSVDADFVRDPNTANIYKIVPLYRAELPPELNAEDAREFALPSVVITSDGRVTGWLNCNGQPVEDWCANCPPGTEGMTVYVQ
jgi:hypothetical protein